MTSKQKHNTIVLLLCAVASFIIVPFFFWISGVDVLPLHRGDSTGMMFLLATVVTWMSSVMFWKF